MQNISMSTKLMINLRDGIVTVEGSEEFVRTIYQDFKERIAKLTIFPAEPPRQLERHSSSSEEIAEHIPHRKIKSHRPPNAVIKKPRTDSYKLNFNTNLNLAGLDTFYDEWAPRNNFEKILIFAIFLRDRLQIAPCTAGDIYTCFHTLKSKTKTPEAFVQAFRDAQHRTHFIEFTSPQAVQITIAGDNHFNQKLKEKGSAR